MRSMLRRSCALVAAGVFLVLGLSASPPLMGHALALGPIIPYVDNDQDADQPPSAWLLMAPPTTNSGLTVDTQAGLAQWITYGRYNTLKDCTTTIQLVRNGAIPVSGLPAQMSNGAIEPDAVPGGAMQPGYGATQPGYPGTQPGYPSMQPGQVQPGQALGQSGYPGMQPSYPGQSGYQGASPGYSAMQPGYGSNQPGAQPTISQPAQLMTRQQSEAAYCFANNDRRLKGLITPPPPPMPLGQ
jgi:hypothetical protein